MPIKYSNEGDLVADLIYGRGDNPRETAPEPSLLPQLGAKLCHWSSIKAVLEITYDLAKRPGNAPPFTPLWEATVWGVAQREDVAGHLDDIDVVTDDYWRVIRVLQTHDAVQARQLADAGVSIGADYPDLAGVARLAPLLPRDNVARLLDTTSDSPMDLDSESIRSLLSAARSHNLDVPDTWIDDALRDNWFGIDEPCHLAHVVPSLQPARRTEIGDRLAGRVSDWRLPPDQRALWVSRIAPFVSSPAAWHPDSLLGDLSPVWHAHIGRCGCAAASYRSGRKTAKQKLAASPKHGDCYRS